MTSAEVKTIANQIRTMRIRGAGRIARAAAKALKITAKTSKAKTPNEFLKELDRVSEYLLSTRPTAVSLPNAVRFITLKPKLAKDADLRTLQKMVVSRADELIH